MDGWKEEQSKEEAEGREGGGKEGGRWGEAEGSEGSTVNMNGN